MAFEIEEFREIGRFDAQVAMHPPVAPRQIMAVSGTSARSTAFGAETHYLSLYSDVACRFQVGGEGVAATPQSTPLPAGGFVDIGVQPGAFIAVIAA